jgi:SAM-dependent methyltransferase
VKCRHCGSAVTLPFVDLGSAPPSNAYITGQALKTPEKWFPLRVLVCEKCWLVQTEDFADASELFNADYAYFSSISNSWLQHAQEYVGQMVARLGLGKASHVVEIGANDGYLLQYVQSRGIPCTGVEPTAAAAAVARSRGLRIVEDFFGVRLASALVEQVGRADLVVANNVLAHVPDINDFLAGFSILLAPSGVATFEFPHLLRLIEGNQFDTIYHEHYSYLSLGTVDTMFAANGLTVFDVEEHPTHGGSLRVFAKQRSVGPQVRSGTVDEIINREQLGGLTSRELYVGFQARAEKAKNDFLSFLLDAKNRRLTVAAYGAAAKGNTLMNYAGVRPDLLAFVVDRNPAKQGKFMPGSRIPIVDENCLRVHRPNLIVILPWNLKSEIAAQLNYAREWGAEFVTGIPCLEIA